MVNRNMVIRIEQPTANRIKISLPYNPTYISKIKSFEGYRWHPTGRYWTLPLTTKIVDQLLTKFEEETIVLDPSLKANTEFAPMFEELKKELVSRRYSPKTVKSYIRYNKDFLNFINKLAPS